jgi:hypothetical protein
MRHSIIMRLLATVSLAAALAAPAFGQGTSVSILGTVYDQSKAVLPGVTVTATERDTGQKRTSVTDDQGRFVMAQMKVGPYTIEAELPGFQTASRDVEATLEGDAVVNLTLGVAAAAGTEVTVTSEAALVETTSSSVASLVDHQQIRDLPLNGRSFTDLATIQTGVVVDYNGARTQIGNEGVKISIAGARRTSNLFQLDGTDLRNQRHHQCRQCRVRRVYRRGHQRGDQVRNQCVPRHAIRIPEKQLPRRPEFFRSQGRTSSIQAQPVRFYPWRPDPNGQGFLFYQL